MILRCIATVEQNGQTHRGLASAGFRPEEVKPTREQPDDFDQFSSAGEGAVAKFPIDAQIAPLPEYGNTLADCYQLNFQNVGAGNEWSRSYGILCGPRKYPAILSVPDAGICPYRALAFTASSGERKIKSSESELKI